MKQKENTRNSTKTAVYCTRLVFSVKKIVQTKQKLTAMINQYWHCIDISLDRNGLQEHSYLPRHLNSHAPSNIYQAVCLNQEQVVQHTTIEQILICWLFVSSTEHRCIYYPMMSLWSAPIRVSQGWRNRTTSLYDSLHNDVLSPFF